MTTAEELMDLIQLRLDGYDMFGVDPFPGTTWSHQLDESQLLLLRLHDDLDDMRHAESEAEADEIWEKIRPFILTFHVGGDAPN